LAARNPTFSLSIPLIQIFVGDSALIAKSGGIGNSTG
jgi:hypothetical protein